MSAIRLLAGEAQSGESSKAIQACNDWLRIGPGRAISELHRRYTESHINSQHEPPSRVYDTLRQWSSRYGWSSRADEWDATAEDRKNTEYDIAMKTGLALDYERVNGLKQLAEFLEGQIYERGATGKYHNVWVPDVKVVGYGDDAEVVDIERFNGAILQQYRGTLDDLAKETGGRINKQELFGKDGKEIIFRIGNIDLEHDI